MHGRNANLDQFQVSRRLELLFLAQRSAGSLAILGDFVAIASINIFSDRHSRRILRKILFLMSGFVLFTAVCHSAEKPRGEQSIPTRIESRRAYARSNLGIGIHEKVNHETRICACKKLFTVLYDAFTYSSAHA